MRNLRWHALLLVVVAAGLLAGCSRDPNVVKQKYFQSGMQYFEKGKYREAAIQFQNAVNTDPQYVEAHYQLARCYLKLAMWSGAYGELQRTVDLAPQNWKARIDLGNLLLAAHDTKKAEEQATAVLAGQPDSADAHTLMAGVYAQEDKLQASLEEMKTAVQLAPQRSESYLALADLQVVSKQTAAAEESYRKAAELDPKSVRAVLALGNFYQQQQRWTDAEKEFRKAMEVDPKDPDPRAALARLMMAQGHQAEAEQVVTQAKNDLSDNPEGYRMLGDFYFNAGELDIALAEYTSLYQQHPKDLRVKKNYAQLLVLRDRLDDAKKLDDEILKDDPKEAEAQILRGQILIRQRRPEDAIPVLQSALKSEPDNATGHYYLGNAFNLTGNIGEAEREWREAVRLRPNLADAQEALAKLAISRHDTDLLQQCAEALIGAQPSSPRGYILRASARFARQDVAGTEADLKKAIELAPQNAVGYSRLGSLRGQQRRYGEAEKLFERALELDPNFPEALQGLVANYVQQKQPARAVERVSAQIARAPNNSAFYFLLGVLLTNSKEFDKAETALQKAVAVDQNNSDAFILLGRVQANRGSLDQAVASLEQAIKENLRDARTYVMLGSLEEKKGDWQKAEEAYQKALQVQPEYAVAANNLAYLMLEHGGNVDSALSLAQVARRGMPDSESSADTLAWAYYQKGTYRLAIDLLEEAVKKSPNDLTFQYHLGLAYLKARNAGLARNHLERALQINPKSPQADNIRKVLSELSGG